MNDGLRLSQDGAALVKHFESCLVDNHDGTFRAYLCPAGKLTIGWGHTNDHGRRFDASSRWTQAECDAAFSEDMQGFEAHVHRLVMVPLSQHQFDALVSFTYNCGDGALQRSALLSKLNRGDYDGASREFPKWNRGGGRVLNGLVKRRAAEMMLFQDGHSDAVHTLAQHAGQHGMPQQADEPTPPKSIAASKTGGAAIAIGGGAGIEVFNQVNSQLDQVSDIKNRVEGLGLHLPDLTTMLGNMLHEPTTLFAMAVVGLAGFIWFDRRKKLNEDHV